MVSEVSGQGWGVRHPAPAMLADGQFEAEAVMVVAEVRETANDEQAGVQGLGLLGQGACAAGQPMQALAQGGIEAFNGGGIDDAERSLGGLAQVVDPVNSALHDAAFNGQGGGKTPFDDLDNGHLRPGH